ncbi:hypothetical protein [uncultured Pseudoteredinibacter sp.]|uniref:hypothetical protein n=1 Tax=uncultured Pseudoteredinibacter sp. TaxID=1641701 RepID=UPI002634E733|nr:hypothetical protein [uncultured Pseudoteredinibacter sp.]
MKSIAKWVTIIWSLFCLIGMFAGIASVGEELNRPMTEMEEAGAGIGIGCGMFVWFFVWAAISGPSALIWTMSGNKKEKATKSDSEICRECGKFYSGNPKFCPSCGNEI